jgi:hypothetical protein
VLGESGRQYVTSSSLCHDYWTPVPLSRQQLDKFLEGIGREQIAVMITAKAGRRPADYADVLERRWAVPHEKRSPGRTRTGALRDRRRFAAR